MTIYLPHLKLWPLLVLWIIAVAVSIIEIQTLALEVGFLIDNPAGVHHEEAAGLVLQGEALELPILVGERDIIAGEDATDVCSQLAGDLVIALNAPHAAVIAGHYLPCPGNSDNRN